MNLLFIDKGFCKTAPAKPGLLITSYRQPLATKQNIQHDVEQDVLCTLLNYFFLLQDYMLANKINLSKHVYTELASGLI